MEMHQHFKAIKKLFKAEPGRNNLHVAQTEQTAEVATPHKRKPEISEAKRKSEREL